MSCAECCSGIRDWSYNVTHTPISRRKFLIGVAVVVVLLVVVIVLAATLSAGSGGAVVPRSGSQVLKEAAVALGSSDLLWSVKEAMNDLLGTTEFGNLTASCKSCGNDLSALRRAGVAAQVWSIRTGCKDEYKDAVALSLEQIDLLKRLVATNSTAVIATSYTDVAKAFLEGRKVASFLGLVGGQSVDGRAALLRSFHDLGVRLFAPADPLCPALLPLWAQVDKTGLTDFGKGLVSEANRVGLALDLTGTSKELSAEVIKLSKAPVLFSHSNALAVFANTSYNLDNETLALVKANKGLVMVSFAKYQVNATGNIDLMIKNIQFLRDTLGVDCVGLGGGYDSINGTAEDLKNPGEALEKIFDALKKNGWADGELEKLAGQNFVRLLKSVEDAKTTENTRPFEELQPETNYKETACYSDFDTRYKK